MFRALLILLVTVDFNDLFVRAWRLVWRRRLLWLLGFVAVAGGGGVGVVGRVAASPAGFLSPDVLQSIVRNPIPVFITTIVLALFIWLAATLAEGALIQTVAWLDAGREVSVRQAFAAGVRLLGRFVAIDTVLFLPLFLLVLAITGICTGLVVALALGADGGMRIEAVLATLGGGLLLCVLPLSCLLLPAGVLTFLFRLLAFRGAALDELGVRASLRRAWRLLRARPGAVVTLGALLWGLRYLVNLLLGLVTLPLASLAVAPVVGQWVSGGGVPAGEMLLAVLAILAVAVITLLPQALLYAFTGTAWTLAYPRLAGKDEH